MQPDDPAVPLPTEPGATQGMPGSKNLRNKTAEELTFETLIQEFHHNHSADYVGVTLLIFQALRDNGFEIIQR